MVLPQFAWYLLEGSSDNAYHNDWGGALGPAAGSGRAAFVGNHCRAGDGEPSARNMHTAKFIHCHPASILTIEGIEPWHYPQTVANF
jgi:hypothetical protein